ncbi:RING-type domain-containing protein [Heracleum sosnowskyi]|uniref:RING-type domain-containing protein n=1 Tax=Heracleum sosnowskyi TaxID=360622 RepID=A0AAD8N015_9APIA|nr:RING-type domain-containing protein [Heracleum sosnowskyi]
MRMNLKLPSEYNIFMLLLLLILLICILHYLFPKLNPGSIRQSFLLSYLPYFFATKKYPDGVKLSNYQEEEGAKGGQECSVCLSEIKQGDEIMQLRCHHFFHALCLKKWLVSYGQFTCPFCRASLSPSSSSPSSRTTTVVYSESGVEVISYNFFSSSGSRRRNTWGLM